MEIHNSYSVKIFYLCRSDFQNLKKQCAISNTYALFSSSLPETPLKMRKTCADIVGYLTKLGVFSATEKWPPARRSDMQAMDRRSPILTREASSLK